MNHEVKVKIPQEVLDKTKHIVDNILIEMIKSALRNRKDGQFPGIICLCGSTRFKEQFIKANFVYTMAGYIVLTVGFFGHADKDKYDLSMEEKIHLDELHKRKIDLADEVVVICPGGYIGDSTRSEIEYAEKFGKKVTYIKEVIE